MKRKDKTTLSDKDVLVQIGTVLNNQFGEKKYYETPEVLVALTESKINDVLIRAQVMSIYCSHTDFNSYHKSVSGDFYYTELRTEMTKKLSDYDGTSNYSDRIKHNSNIQINAIGKSSDLNTDIETDIVESIIENLPDIDL